MSHELEPVPVPCVTLRLPKLATGWQAVQYAALADGNLAVVSTDVDLEAESQLIRAAHLASSRHDHSRLHAHAAVGKARVCIAGSEGWIEALSFSLETPFPIFDRFNDGRWLVVNRPSREDANARVFSPEGAAVARFKLGGGVNHLQIDASNRIWVGWSDEGMLGNSHWSVPGLPWPPCRNGVACFDSDGTVLPLPEWPNIAGSVADCYALNVSEQGAWTCPYTDFPLVCFVPGKPARWWRNKLLGPQAIAMGGSHALIAGGFIGNANRLALVELEEGGQGEEISHLASWALPLRRSPPPANEWASVWSTPDLLAGRGDILHLVDDDLWHRWRVGELVTQR